MKTYMSSYAFAVYTCFTLRIAGLADIFNLSNVCVSSIPVTSHVLQTLIPNEPVSARTSLLHIQLAVLMGTKSTVRCQGEF